MNLLETETPASRGKHWGRGGCTGDGARQGSKVTEKGLKSRDPGFKFPGSIYGIFPQEVYRHLKLASV